MVLQGGVDQAQFFLLEDGCDGLRMRSERHKFLSAGVDGVLVGVLIVRNHLLHLRGGLIGDRVQLFHIMAFGNRLLLLLKGFLHLALPLTGVLDVANRVGVGVGLDNRFRGLLRLLLRGLLLGGPLLHLVKFLLALGQHLLELGALLALFLQGPERNLSGLLVRCGFLRFRGCYSGFCRFGLRCCPLL